jgi:hypothetical protein
MSETTHITNAKRMRFAGVGAAVTGVLLLLGVLLPVHAAAKDTNWLHTVTLCHRTDSYTNPYRVITVDVDSVFKQGHDGHEGKVFYPEIPKHEKWGDIIPAFDYGDGQHYDGMNLTDEGRAILNNNCVPPVSTTTTTIPDTTTTTIPDTTTTTIPDTTTTTIPDTTTTTIPDTTTTTIPDTTTTIPDTTTSTAPGTTSTTAPATTTTAPGTTTTTAQGTQVQGAQQARTALPVTGSNAVLIGALGVVLTLGGAALVIVAQRRSAGAAQTVE